MSMNIVPIGGTGGIGVANAYSFSASASTTQNVDVSALKLTTLNPAILSCRSATGPLAFTYTTTGTNPITTVTFTYASTANVTCTVNASGGDGGDVNGGTNLFTQNATVFVSSSGTLNESAHTKNVNGIPYVLRDITGTGLFDQYWGYPGYASLGLFQYNGYLDYGVVFAALGDNSYGMWNEYFKSRSTDGNTPATCQNNDQVMHLRSLIDAGSGAYDGQITGIGTYVDGVPSTSSTPGRIELLTTDSNQTGPNHGVYIKSTGNVLIGSSNAETGYKMDIQESGTSGTLRVYDSRPSVGNTKTIIQTGAGQTGNPFEIFDGVSTRASISALGGLRTAPTTVSTLPVANSGNRGTFQCVSDATSTTIGSTVSGGGSNVVLVWSNGSTWEIFASAGGSYNTFPLISGSPAIDVTNGYTSGGYVIDSVSVNETGKPGFSSTLTMYPGSNGATVRDNVLSVGYNRGASGKQIAGQQSFYWNIESDYTTSEGVRQLEFYYGYESPSGAYSVRPFSITPHINLNTVEVATRAESIKFGYSDTSNDWLRLTSTNSSGEMALVGNASITYDATNRYFIFSQGQGLLGYAGGVGYLFKGLPTATFFDLYGISDSDLTINVGGGSVAGTRGLRWSSTTNQWQYQYNLDGGGTAWRNMFIPTPKTVSQLQAASSNLKGATDTVTDASGPVVGSTVVGGGSTVCQVWCNGSAWKVSAV